MGPRTLRLLAVFFALALVAAACGDDDDGGGDTGSGDGDGGGSGGSVSIFGPEVEGELAGFAEAMVPFEEESGVDVSISGDRSAEQNLGVQVQGGSPPDIFVFPQPGRLQEFAESGDLVPLRDDVAEAVRENFPETFWSLAEVDGELYGVPNKADVKSLVWYSPTAFSDGGYEVPETHAELMELSDQMVADGSTPFCIGIGSDAATGWPFTDWVEDYMLRLKGPDVYDQWVNHEIPFDDPDVVEVGEFVMDIWETEGYVFGGTQTIANTPFAESGLGLLDDSCMMHRQANFYEANFPEGTDISEDGEIWAFYLPPVDDGGEGGRPLLSAGTILAAFSDSEATMDALLYAASPEYPAERAQAQIGFLSPNSSVEASAYQNNAAALFLDILDTAETVRFDASDLMPGAVGSGSFWSAAVDITTGSKTVAEAFAEVEASWPEDE
ncbi:MAG: ABC transporter substrate-binding protein [Acidimicrobiales bacterium]